jgi:hypothetical protein
LTWTKADSAADCWKGHALSYEFNGFIESALLEQSNVSLNVDAGGARATTWWKPPFAFDRAAISRHFVASPFSLMVVSKKR